jgi:hypothetical protein
MIRRHRRPFRLPRKSATRGRMPRKTPQRRLTWPLLRREHWRDYDEAPNAHPPSTSTALPRSHRIRRSPRHPMYWPFSTGFTVASSATSVPCVEWVRQREWMRPKAQAVVAAVARSSRRVVAVAVASLATDGQLFDTSSALGATTSLTTTVGFRESSSCASEFTPMKVATVLTNIWILH